MTIVARESIKELIRLQFKSYSLGSVVPLWKDTSRQGPILRGDAGDMSSPISGQGGQNTFCQSQSLLSKGKKYLLSPPNL